MSHPNFMQKVMSDSNPKHNIAHHPDYAVPASMNIQHELHMLQSLGFNTHQYPAHSIQTLYNPRLQPSSKNPIKVETSGHSEALEHSLRSNDPKLPKLATNGSTVAGLVGRQESLPSDVNVNLNVSLRASQKGSCQSDKDKLKKEKHNLIERKRRDRINEYSHLLGYTCPTTEVYDKWTKGSRLENAYDHVRELQGALKEQWMSSHRLLNLVEEILPALVSNGEPALPESRMNPTELNKRVNEERSVFEKNRLFINNIDNHKDRYKDQADKILANFKRKSHSQSQSSNGSMLHSNSVSSMNGLESIESSPSFVAAGMSNAHALDYLTNATAVQRNNSLPASHRVTFGQTNGNRAGQYGGNGQAFTTVNNVVTSAGGPYNLSHAQYGYMDLRESNKEQVTQLANKRTQNKLTLEEEAAQQQAQVQAQVQAAQAANLQQQQVQAQVQQVQSELSTHSLSPKRTKTVDRYHREGLDTNGTVVAHNAHKIDSEVGKQSASDSGDTIFEAPTIEGGNRSTNIGTPKASSPPATTIRSRSVAVDGDDEARIKQHNSHRPFSNSLGDSPFMP